MKATDLIDEIGGTANVAAECGVSLAAVSNWRNEGIPGYRLDFLRLKFPAVLGALKNADIQPVAKGRRRPALDTRN